MGPANFGKILVKKGVFGKKFEIFNMWDESFEKNGDFWQFWLKNGET